MKNCIFKTLTFLISIGSFSSTYAMVDIMGSGGYSTYPNFGSSNFKGWNAGAKILVTDSPSTFDWVYGGGFRYENVKADNSDSGVSISSTITTFQLGGDIGFKIMPIKEISLYALGSLYIGVYNNYSNTITFNGSSGTVNPSVNSNWNIGIGGTGLFNVTPDFGIGAGIYVARGAMSYSDTTSNGYTSKGSSGGYNIYNYNLVACYSF